MIPFLAIASKSHGLLIALYPEQFRVEFGPEMQLVFSQLLRDEAERGRIPLLGAVLREIWGTSISALYQRLRWELTDEGDIRQALRGMQSVGSTCGAVLLVLTALYALLIVMSFVGKEFHQLAYPDMASSYIRIYPSFLVGIEWRLHRLAVLAVLLTGLGTLILGPMLLLYLLFSWRRLPRSQQLLWLGTLATNVTATSVATRSLDLISAWAIL